MRELFFNLYHYILSPLLLLLVLVLVAYVILSWMASMGQVSRQKHAGVFQTYALLYSIVEPMLKPIRRVVPLIGGRIDLAPLILLLIIQFARGYAIPRLIMLIPI